LGLLLIASGLRVLMAVIILLLDLSFWFLM